MSEDYREEFSYECNECGGRETFFQYRANYVCPWCGQGVMEREEVLDEKA